MFQASSRAGFLISTKPVKKLQPSSNRDKRIFAIALIYEYVVYFDN